MDHVDVSYHIERHGCDIQGKVNGMGFYCLCCRLVLSEAEGRRTVDGGRSLALFQVLISIQRRLRP